MSDVVLRSETERSRWIPWVFVGGMLLVVVVNLILVWFALTTFTGVTVGQAYDRGRTYNHVIEAAARQEALGWQAAHALEDGRLTVRVTDRQGVPIDATAVGRLQRPLDGSVLPLTFRALGSGHFVASTESAQPGQWDLHLVFVSVSGDRLEVRNRMIVR
jgi:nitrogen fixation protein FixH